MIRLNPHCPSAMEAEIFLGIALPTRVAIKSSLKILYKLTIEVLGRHMTRHEEKQKIKKEIFGRLQSGWIVKFISIPRTHSSVS